MKNRKMIENTLQSLAGSQGFYSRLWRDYREASEEEKEQFCKQFENCRTSVDFVLALEQ